MSLPPAQPPEAVLDHIGPGTDVIVPLAAGEPVAVLDAIEAAGPSLERVRIHQMHASRDMPYMSGVYGDRLRHVSYFLSSATRKHFAEGTIDLVPNHFKDVGPMLRNVCHDPLILVRASPPDRHGFFSFGTNADYVASFLGRARFFLEVDKHMPRTFGRNQIHATQIEGWCQHDEPLPTHDPKPLTDRDRRIAAHVSPLIPDGATIQVGIGSIPDAVLASLDDHNDLGIHTELLSDGLVHLIESGVANGVKKRINRTKAIATFAYGSKQVYEFLHENTAVELWPASYVNNPFTIAGEPGFVSINSTVCIDLMGQCASETIGSRYWSSSGGQSDFAQGARLSEGGSAYIVMPSTAKGGTVSRIVPQLPPGAVVTTLKNTVDNVVTEFGVASLRGTSVRQRAARLIEVAHPDHREMLRDAATHLWRE